VIVPRRVCARAVDRNRIKRIVRESFRHAKPLLCGQDVVVIAQQASSNAMREALADSLRTFWLKLQSQCAP